MCMNTSNMFCTGIQRHFLDEKKHNKSNCLTIKNNSGQGSPEDFLLYIYKTLNTVQGTYLRTFQLSLMTVHANKFN